MARRTRPEDLAASRLGGIARRHANSDDLDVAAAVAELRAVPAAGPACMAEVAGVLLGFHRTAMDFDSRVVEAALLILAGADLSRLQFWIEEGRKRAAQPAHFSPD